MCSKSIIIAAAFGVAAHGAALAGESAIFIDDFPGTDLNGWGGGGGNTYENPGTGGVGGVDDGFLKISRDSEGRFATRSFEEPYARNYIADGVTSISLWLNNLGTDDGHVMHVALGNQFAFYQYNEPFTPTDEWTKFLVDLTDESNWTQTSLFPGTFEEALMNADRLLIRHDPAPFAPIGPPGPDPTSGDIGIDRIALIPGPSAGAAMIAVAGALGLRRRR